METVLASVSKLDWLQKHRQWFGSAYIGVRRSLNATSRAINFNPATVDPNYNELGYKEILDIKKFFSVPIKKACKIVRKISLITKSVLTKYRM